MSWTRVKRGILISVVCCAILNGAHNVGSGIKLSTPYMLLLNALVIIGAFKVAADK